MLTAPPTPSSAGDQSCHVLEGAVVGVGGQGRVRRAGRVHGGEAVAARFDDRDVQDRARRVGRHAAPPGDDDVEHAPGARREHADAVVRRPRPRVDEPGRRHGRDPRARGRRVRRQVGQRRGRVACRGGRVAARIDRRWHGIERRLDELAVGRRASPTEVHAVRVEPRGLAFAEGVPLAHPELRPSPGGRDDRRIVRRVVAGAGDVLVGEPHDRGDALRGGLLHDGVDVGADRPVVVARRR